MVVVVAAAVAVVVVLKLMLLVLVLVLVRLVTGPNPRPHRCCDVFERIVSWVIPGHTNYPSFPHEGSLWVSEALCTHVCTKNARVWACDICTQINQTISMSDTRRINLVQAMYTCLKKSAGWRPSSSHHELDHDQGIPYTEESVVFGACLWALWGGDGLLVFLRRESTLRNTTPHHSLVPRY